MIGRLYNDTAESQSYRSIMKHALSPIMDASTLGRLFTVISVIGIVLNTLNFIVFIRRPMRPTYNTLFLWITVCDLASCSYYLAMNILMPLEGKPDVQFIIVQFIFATFNLTSFWLCCFLVIFPRVKYLRELNTIRIYGIVVSTFVTLILLNAPPMIVWSVASNDDDNASEEVRYRIHEILIIANTIALRVIPFVILTAFTVVITFELSNCTGLYRIASSEIELWKEKHHHNHHRINRSVVLILSTSIFALTTDLPALVLQMTYKFLHVGVAFVNEFNLATGISRMVQVSARFFIYYAASREFRTMVHNEFGGTRRIDPTLVVIEDFPLD